MQIGNPLFSWGNEIIPSVDTCSRTAETNGQFRFLGTTLQAACKLICYYLQIVNQLWASVTQGEWRLWSGCVPAGALRRLAWTTAEKAECEECSTPLPLRKRGSTCPGSLHHCVFALCSNFAWFMQKVGSYHHYKFPDSSAPPFQFNFIFPSHNLSPKVCFIIITGKYWFIISYVKQKTKASHAWNLIITNPPCVWKVAHFQS